MPGDSQPGTTFAMVTVRNAVDVAEENGTKFQISQAGKESVRETGARLTKGIVQAPIGSNDPIFQWLEIRRHEAAIVRQSCGTLE